MTAPTTVTHCWQAIGVWRVGGAACERLAKFEHCANCPVYHEAGQSLLDRELSDEDLAEATARVRQPVAPRDPDRLHALAFRLGDAIYALPLSSCDGVSPSSTARRVPHRNPDILLGVVNVFGRVIPCVSLDGLLARRREATSAPRVMIVLRSRERQVALPVDAVIDQMQYHRSDVTGVAASAEKGPPGIVEGMVSWRDATTMLLDTGRLWAVLEAQLA